MSSRIILVFFLLILTVSGCLPVRETPIVEDRALPGAPAPAGTVTKDSYRLGTGDVLSIRVYDWRSGPTPSSGDEDLRIEKIRLDHSGIVNMPFGEFKAAGQTVREFENALTDSLRGRILRDPRVWVNIEEYRPFFVEGQVGRPGAYPYQPGLNVRQAIAIGGGMRERASVEKIYIVREGDRSNARMRVNLNSPVGPGDTISVEESFF